MLTRAKLLVFDLVVCLVLLALCLAAIIWPRGPTGVSRESYRRIREGMTEAQVEAIIGWPGNLFGLKELAEEQSMKCWLYRQSSGSSLLLIGLAESSKKSCFPKVISHRNRHGAVFGLGLAWKTRLPVSCYNVTQIYRSIFR